MRSNIFIRHLFGFNHSLYEFLFTFFIVNVRSHNYYGSLKWQLIWFNQCLLFTFLSHYFHRGLLKPLDFHSAYLKVPILLNVDDEWAIFMALGSHVNQVIMRHFKIMHFLQPSGAMILNSKEPGSTENRWNMVQVTTYNCTASHLAHLSILIEG